MKHLDCYDQAISGLRRISGLAVLLEIAARSPEPLPEDSLQEAANMIREKTEEVQKHLRSIYSSMKP